MNILSHSNLGHVLSYFDLSDKLLLATSELVEPDCVLYTFTAKSGSRYGLECRDYISDDLDIEMRILHNEHKISVIDWIRTKDAADDYRLYLEGFDKFAYVFVLFKYENVAF